MEQLDDLYVKNLMIIGHDCMTKKVDLTLPAEELIKEYDTRLVAAAVGGERDGNTTRPLAMLKWLHSTDFYTAPASSRYHESFQHGLLIHSLRVFNALVDIMWGVPSFASKVVPSEAVLCALVHDWCKIGYYESYEKNVKNEATGQWEKQTAYRINQRNIALGHGVTSMFLISRFLVLSPDCALAIRWHMGEYNVADNEVNELQKANSEVPLVYLLQFADRLACTDYFDSDYLV